MTEKTDKLEDTEKSHSHSFLDPEYDPYLSYDHEMIGGKQTANCCPRCGYAIKSGEKVMRFDGEEGTVWELAPEDANIPLYHRKCLRERNAEKAGQENASLDDFV